MKFFVAYAVRLLPAVWIALLLAPSVVWVILDKRVWAWDPSYYAFSTLRLTHGMASVGAWIHEFFHTLKMMPPLMVWLGQIFVPLRHATGDIETALELFNIVVAAGTLYCIYRVARALAEGMGPKREVLIALTAVTICGGAPLYISLIHHYLTEPLQSFAAAISVAVALHAERRSARRNAAYVLLMIAISFLVKATSFLFVIPAMTYIAVARYLTRNDPRPPATQRDNMWLAVGVCAFVLMLGWYIPNWHEMTVHFVQASVGEEVQQYKARQSILMQLAYWVRELGAALVIKRFGAVVLVLLALAAFIVAALRLRTHGHVLKAAVAGNGLFALYVTGTIAGIVLAYSLQINPDPRYILIAVPLVAVLIAWALTVLRCMLFCAAIFAAATANAAVVNASSLGVSPWLYPWLWPVDRKTTEMEAVTGAVAASCNDSGETHPVAVAVSFRWANANTANFYAWKQRVTTGTGCLYYHMPQTDLDNIWQWMDQYKVEIVVTATRDPLDNVPEFANKKAQEIAAFMASSPRFELMPGSTERFQIYKRLNQP